MKVTSILNHVLGPVMRGPSSSHTAGGYHIGAMARSLLGGTPRRAVVAFDPAGSYARTFVPQGADRALAQGLLGRPLTDETYFSALGDAKAQGVDVRFEVRQLREAHHPNTVEIALTAADGARLDLTARSIGGGEVEIVRLDGWPVCFTGASHETLIEMSSPATDPVVRILEEDGKLLGRPATSSREGAGAVVCRRTEELPPELVRKLQRLPGYRRALECAPVYLVQVGEPPFASASELVAFAAKHGRSLGEAACEYESRVLGRDAGDVVRETLRRWDIMVASAERGLDPGFRGLQLLSASAGSVYQAEAAGRLALGGPHTRAAARALAVMHSNGAMGVVCAAPTGGSAGVLPGALVTLAEERPVEREALARALLAAGAVGVVVAQRSTFAAEVAGCQVEIGAAGAMAAAAVVEAAGGSAEEATNAAAIALQNSMGSVCDLVHGTVEIPCHTRNAAAASSAFVCADLVLGGYQNPIPLDETIDAVHAVGRAMPSELRCTSRGGLAVTPSALALEGGSCEGGCCR